MGCEAHLRNKRATGRALRGAVLAAGLLLAGSPARADLVRLKNGRTIEGRAESRGDEVIIRTERGSLTIPRAEIDHIEPKALSWETYEARARALKPDDVAGHLALAKWCKDHDLGGRMQQELQAVLAADPANEEAHKSLGHEKVGGRWMSPEEAHRVRGETLVEGRWLSAAEYEDHRKKKEAADRLKATIEAARAQPDKDTPSQTKTGYELFLEKGRIIEFPARKWDQAFVYNSQCYSVRTNTSADVAEYVGVLMDAVHYCYCQRFGVQGTRRANIAVFRTKEEMFEFAKTRYKWSPPAGCDGFFSESDGGTICVPWQRLAGWLPENVLMHEGTHQFVAAVFGDILPIWLNEGFAVYFENSRFDGKSMELGRIPTDRLRRLQIEMESGSHLSLEKLFATGQERFGLECYAAAWAFVFWLAHAGDAREVGIHQQALAQFVADCRKGKKDGRVLATYLGRGNMATLEKEWKEWVMKLDPADPYGGIRKSQESPNAVRH